MLIRPFEPGDGAAITGWRYPPPYDFYNADRETVHDPALATSDTYAMVEGDELVGTCSFGLDARVPGGSYDDGALDVGLSMRPDLTGRGRGSRYLEAALAFATSNLGATSLRATVAEVNERALRLCERAGFRRVARFENTDRAYWILVRAAPMMTY